MNGKVFLISGIFALILGAAWKVDATPSPTTLKNQDPDIQESINRFEAAALEHRRELIDLYRTRGRAYYRLTEISLESISNMLSNTHPMFSSTWNFWSDDRLAYPEGTVVIFYSHEEDNLEIWVTVPSVAVVGAKKEAHFPSVLPNRRE
jgi:hypothetical protein